MQSHVKGLVYAGITAVCWGFLAIGLKMATEFMDSASIVWFRFSVAFFSLLIILAIRQPDKLKILRKPPVVLIIAALFLAVNYYGFMKGVALTDPNISQIMIQVGPILLGLSGFVVFKERINWKQAGGFIVASIGLILFYQENLKSFILGADVFEEGVWWIIIAGVAWTVYAILQKFLLKKISALEMNLVIFGVPMLLFIPFINLQQISDLNFLQFILLIALGLNTLIAYGTLALALQYTDANKVSVIITMNPILTVILMTIIAYFEVSWMKGSILSLEASIAAILVIGGGTMAVLLKSKPRKLKMVNKLPDPGN